MKPTAPGRRRLLLACLALPVLPGCAVVAPLSVARSPSSGLPRRVELGQVPFFPQEDYQCGPAALAAVLQHAGVPRTPQELVGQVYLPARQGSLQPEMLAATRRASLLAYPLAPSMDALYAELAAGRPVLVLQNLRWSWTPLWHYAVAIGYDLDAGTVLLRSGLQERLEMPVAPFTRSWARAQHWAFVALPPDRLPARPNEAGYVAAAAALERVSPAAGEVAYATALTAWPRNLFARMALGNAAFRRRDLSSAEAAYRQATQDHPASADAWNNLAQALHARGEAPGALAAAEQAVRLGGPRQATYEATLREVRVATSTGS